MTFLASKLGLQVVLFSYTGQNISFLRQGLQIWTKPSLIEVNIVI